MPDDTLKHPAVTPTTTIIFNGIIDINHGRTATNSEDFGSTTGVSKQAASNRTQSQCQVSIKLITNSTSSVRAKVKALMDLYKAEAEDDMEIVINFSDGGTVTWVGKVVNVNGTFVGGSGSVQWIGTIDMNIATSTWS